MSLIHSRQLNPKLTGSFTLSGSIVATGGVGTISASKFAGDGSSLTNISSTGIDGELGIFTPTGSVYSTTNDVQLTGSLKANAVASASRF